MPKSATYALILVLGSLLAGCQPASNEGGDEMKSAVLLRQEQATPSLPPEPRAAKKPFVVTSPNGNRQDPWYWLRDDERKNPEVLAYLEAENAWAAAYEARYAGLVDKLYAEILGRIKQDDATVPVRDRGYWYYTRFEEGKEYPIHCRRRDAAGALEEVLLDLNAMAEGHAFFQVGDVEVSDDNHLIAWLEDTVGRRQYVLKVKDLRTGELLLPGIERVSSFVWAADNRTLFYVENHPVTLLSYRVKKHVLGTDAATDTVVYEEQDASFYTGVGRTGSRRFLLIGLSSTEASEFRFLEADRPEGEFRVFLPRERGHLYSPDHVGEAWFVRSNWQAPNFRILRVPLGSEGRRELWQDFVPHREDAFIDGFQAFTRFLVVAERSEGLRRLRIKPMDGSSWLIAADEPAYTMALGDNREQDTDKVRYLYTSLTTPNSVFELDVASGERTLLKQDPVLGDFSAENYRSERLWAPARDGEKIPVSLVYRKGFRRDGSAPLYLHAYGAYGSSRDPSFSTVRLSLLDRGFVFALAHVRGGQELGRRWYEAGRLLNKMNTFTDFIDVADFLVKEGYAAKDKVFAMGGSAGGLLIGAVANMAPERFAGMAAHVPFVDVVTTMLDESIPLTTNEFDEWGNPKEKAFYEYMLSYSPYDNVRPQAYPPLYVTTGLWDSQVQYWEPAKWVAKLRQMRTNDAPILFRTQMEAGHGGRSGRFQRLREVAEEYAFFLHLAGIRE
jgi:oligopeptidase B